MKTVGLMVLLILVFVLGISYQRVLSDATLQKEKLTAARQRFYDWGRFTDHIREDRKAFGDRSLLFPSNTLLDSLHQINTKDKTALLVFQSSLDTVSHRKGSHLKAVIKSPHNPEVDPIKLIVEGRNPLNYEIRMTLVNQGNRSEVLTRKSFSLIDSLGRQNSPFALRESIAGFTIVPKGFITYELLFHRSAPEVPVSMKIADSSESIVFPVEILVFNDRER